MSTIMTSVSGPDRKLHLEIPVADPGEYEVLVTVRPKPAMNREEWQAWVQEMAGSWEGDFVRPPQGEYEVRTPLS